ncbi:MAG: hypothetical protein NC901_02890, partial [Candidatus Omnitrophica bacterium]|nr:hypothetical protein [Candidatus Omnitrophota bacterium]
ETLQAISEFLKTTKFFEDFDVSKVVNFAISPEQLSVAERIMRGFVRDYAELTSIMGSLGGTMETPSILQFLEYLNKIRIEVEKLQQQYNVTREEATKMFADNIIGSKVYKERLVEIGISMWFLSIAISQVSSVIGMLVEDNTMLASSFQLIQQSLGTLTYGWFAWYNMIDMYLKRIKDVGNLPEAQAIKTMASIQKTAFGLSLLISLLIAIIPWIVQFNNKLREGFIKFSSEISQTKRALDDLFNPKTFEQYLSSIEQAWKKFGKIFTRENIKFEDILGIRAKPLELELTIKPILRREVLKNFFKTPEGKKIWNEAYNELVNELNADVTLDKNIIINPDIVWGALPKQPSNREIFERAKQKIEELIGATQEDLDRALKIYTLRYTYLENYIRQNIIPKLSFEDRLRVMDDRELKFLKEKASLTDDIHLEWKIQMEEKRREYEKLGFTAEQVTELLKDLEKQHAQQIANATKALEAKTLKLQGRDYEAFMLDLELELEELRKRGIEEEKILEYRKARINKYFEDLREKQLSFYIDLAKLRGDDEEAFRLSLERQINNFREAGISEIEIKKWVTLQWKKFEEERTEKQKQEQQKRLDAERDFWISYYRIAGEMRKAFDIELEREKERYIERGIKPELVTEYIELKKRKDIEEKSKEILELIKRYSGEETKIRLNEIAKQIEKYREYEELRPLLTQFASTAIQQIWKRETDEIIREIEKRIKQIEAEQEKEIRLIEQAKEKRKRILYETYSFSLLDEWKDIYQIVTQYKEILEDVYNADLANAWLNERIARWIEERNRKETENYEKELEKRKQITQDLELDIIRLYDNSFEYELRRLIDRVNEYIKNGADILKVQEYYSLATIRIKEEETRKWIQEERRKFAELLNLQEDIQQFQEKAFGYKKPKWQELAERKAEEAKRLIRQVFDLVASGQISLEQAIDIVEKQILPYTDITSELGRASPVLKKANEYAVSLAKGFYQAQLNIWKNIPKFETPEFEQIIKEPPPELTEPKQYTILDVMDMITKILASLDEIDKSVNEWYTQMLEKIKEKYKNLIESDEVIKNAVEKLLTLPETIMTSIDWASLGIDIGSIIGTNMYEGIINTLKEKFTDVNWEEFFEEIPPPEIPKPEILPSSNLLMALPAKIDEKIKQITSLPEITIGMPARGIDRLISVNEPIEEKRETEPYIYLFREYLEDRAKWFTKPTQMLFKGFSVDWEEAGWKDILIRPPYYSLDYYPISTTDLLEMYNLLNPVQLPTPTFMQPITTLTTEAQPVTYQKITTPVVNNNVKVYIGTKEIKDIITETVTELLGKKTV